MIAIIVLVHVEHGGWNALTSICLDMISRSPLVFTNSWLLSSESEQMRMVTFSESSSYPPSVASGRASYPLGGSALYLKEQHEEQYSL
jgi:hypothetical protein